MKMTVLQGKTFLAVFEVTFQYTADFFGGRDKGFVGILFEELQAFKERYKNLAELEQILELIDEL